MMKNIIRIVFFLTLLFGATLNLFSQKILNLEEIANAIVEEGKELHRLEKTSWLGTDLFLENYENRSNIGGYLPYVDGDGTKCVFFSRSEKLQVIGTVTFDETFDLDKARVNVKERDLTNVEKDIHAFRAKVLTELNTDTLFKTYNNSKLNLIPLIYKGQKKVYVVTGPKTSGVMLLGNDYLITFDKQNKVVSKKAIHRNLIPIFFGNEDEKAVGAVHSHQRETGEFITATDICSLMLYADFADWDMHYVFSENYVSLWNCKTHKLKIVIRQEFDAMPKD